mgnify:FL=1
MSVAMGLDLGRTGNTISLILSGDKWKLRLTHIETFRNISAPRVEEHVNTLYSVYTPEIIVIENNGPGGVFIDYLVKNNASLPVVGVDTSLPPNDLDELPLWDDLMIHAKEFFNVRAAMYWITKLLFRDKRITLPSEDTELFAQLSGIYWGEHPTNSKIRIQSKKSMKTFESELGSLESTRSPDKADAFCLAALGYALVYRDSQPQVAMVDEIIEPEPGWEGIFPIGRAGITFLE